MNIDFKVPRSKDCILIDTKKWVQNTSNLLRGHRMSGRDFPTYIATALSVNAVKEKYKGLVKEGDLVLLSRVASEVASFRTFEVEVGDKRFYNVPISQVCGVFNEGSISFSSLILFTDKVLVEKVEPKYKQILATPGDNTMLGKVLKTGPESTFEFGDIVLIRDNVTTDITLHGNQYHIVDNDMIVGVFEENKDITLSNMKVLNNSVLMKQHIPERALNSTLLAPVMNYEDSDYSEIYNIDLFRVVAVDEKLTKLHVDDIILLDRSITNYVYLYEEKYFIVGGMEAIEAKIEE